MRIVTCQTGQLAASRVTPAAGEIGRLVADIPGRIPIEARRFGAVASATKPVHFGRTSCRLREGLTRRDVIGSRSVARLASNAGFTDLDRSCYGDRDRSSGMTLKAGHNAEGSS